MGAAPKIGRLTIYRGRVDRYAGLRTPFSQFRKELKSSHNTKEMY